MTDAGQNRLKDGLLFLHPGTRAPVCTATRSAVREPIVALATLHDVPARHIPWPGFADICEPELSCSLPTGPIGARPGRRWTDQGNRSVRLRRHEQLRW